MGASSTVQLNVMGGVKGIYQDGRKKVMNQGLDRERNLSIWRAAMATRIMSCQVEAWRGQENV